MNTMHYNYDRAVSLYTYFADRLQTVRPLQINIRMIQPRYSTIHFAKEGKKPKAIALVDHILSIAFSGI